MTPTEPASLRVLQVVNTLAVSDGGPALHSLDVNAALNARSDTSAHLAWVTGRPDESHLADGVPAGVSTSLGRSGLRELWRQVRGADAVIVHGFYLPWVPWVALACRAHGVPFVVMPHGVFTRYQRQRSRVRKAAFDALGGRATRRAAASFVVATVGEQEELAEAYPGIVSTAVGVGTAMPSAPATGERHEPIRLVTLSRIAPKKRIDVAIDAVALLRDRGVDARLTIAGTGQDELLDGLRAQVRRLRLEDRVVFAGEVRGGAKTAHLVRGDVLVAPSEDENFGISIAEGLAHGLPVVATRFVGAALPADRVAGRVIDEVSAASLADAVEALRAVADFPQLRERARGVAVERYGWASVAGRWRDALARATEERDGELSPAAGGGGRA
ncbi:glycosyltransferase [Demequina mangrovi]|uniref:D-inositol 3-phosphate glycosyltransferase n=1 Tax=Demequina mangrovi TaxID=1043493 RepID=A0A1H6YIC0_9MICO|nr:glycosyltransferase [Demequina mangrovi]SEJ41031.1 Glycosyltransferase involved in cell wall bisynthesis [Demequina mangrovi]